MNKILLLGTAIFISFAAGCEKNAPSTHSSNNTADAFQQADDKITALTDQIEDTDISPSQRQQVLCEKFPQVYKNEYIPALLALNPKDTSQTQLLEEMQFTLNYYQQQLNIKC